MKAISVLQPWARLLAGGSIRFVPWDTELAYTGGVAIHATDRVPDWAEAFARELVLTSARTNWFPRAAIVGVGVIVATHRIDDLRAAGELQEWEERHRGFGVAWHALELDECKPLANPIPSRGALGLWDWTPPEGFEDPQ